MEEGERNQAQEEPLHSPNYDEITEDYPLVSERAGHGDHSDNSMENEKHVQFGPANGNPDDQALATRNLPENVGERKRRKRLFHLMITFCFSKIDNFIQSISSFSRHQYYKQRKYSHPDNCSDMRKSFEDSGEHATRKVSTPDDVHLEVIPIIN